MQDPGNLVWVDLEMTGLEPDQHTIIEIATIVTDAQLTVLAEGPCIAIHVPDSTLDLMDAWCTKTHGESGLVARIKESTIDLAEAERRTLAFIEQWVPKGRGPLCGNSIGHDRRFLRRYMPSVDAWLHYRVIDVSSIKELAKRWYPGLKAPPKKGNHLALDDIRESIEELRFYRSAVFRDTPSPS
ncbi:MAG: oligoribonuclease [Deltaproteobacteria bacterium]|nr:oligoribonuclease [Deltaproteobacteria bacterium]